MTRRPAYCDQAALLCGRITAEPSFVRAQSSRRARSEGRRHCGVCTSCVQFGINAPTFTWDPRKDAANQRKHGISFAEAQSAFLDDEALLLDDPDHSEAEDRFVLIGLSQQLRILVVAHSHRASDAEIRLISARRACRSESRRYAARGH
jgi:uncharacterized protein